MKIIIPMSGFGEDLKGQVIKVPKPLIGVESKPIISHVIDLFGKDNGNLFFICNEESRLQIWRNYR